MAALGPLTFSLPLALGANPFGWTSDDPASHAVLDAFTEAGGSLVDTSDSYGAGASETIIGSWLERTGRRDDLVLATKVSRHPERRGLAPDNVRAAAEESLTRLRTDHIDLYWAHYDDPDVPLADTLGALEDLVQAGKVRALGISNYSPDRITEWLTLAEENGLTVPVALQPEYSLLRRHDYEDAREDIAVEHGLGVLPYWGLASGLLTGKYRSQADVEAHPDSRRSGIVELYVSDAAFAVVDVLREVAAAHSVEPASVALAWLRERPGIVAPIASVSRLDQLPSLLAATSLRLSEAEVDRLTALSDAVGH